MTTSSDDERISIADPDVTRAEIDHVVDVLESGHLSGGETITRFESAFADFCGARHGVATSNGTTALHAILEAIGIGDGDLVVTTPFSFVATANAIRHVGGTPVFADVDPDTYNLDPHEVETTMRRHGDDVAAILAVHLYGLPANMDHLADLADTYDVPLVEDAAQAHGATVDGETVGAIGDAAAFSFYPTKNMTTGEGGMVTTNSEELTARVRKFVDHGRDDRYRHVSVGHNFRMSDLNAAIGLEQLEKLPDYTAARRAHAARYDDALRGSRLQAPIEPDGRRHVYHQYTVRAADASRRPRRRYGGVLPPSDSPPTGVRGLRRGRPRCSDRVGRSALDPGPPEPDRQRRPPNRDRTQNLSSMTAHQIEAGVVGVGRMGTNHARVYKELPEVDLVGVADADPSRAEETAETYGTHPMDTGDLFDDVDVASIAVPPRFHYDVATDAIDAGVDLLIEKPFVTDVSNGRALIERAAANDVTLQVGHIERFNPVVEVLQDILPDLDVIAVTARRLGPPVDRDTNDDVVMDLMIHDIDVVLALLEEDLVSVTATGARNGRHATAQLNFENDVVGTLTASRVTQKKIRDFTITARECLVTVDFIDQSVEIHRHSSPEHVTDDEGYRFRNESVIERPMVESGEPLRRELSSFVDAVSNDVTPEVTAEDGLTAMQLARQISALATTTEQPAGRLDVDELQTA
jgi:dTDP-4-amino-4,6-dideoxygalactose transaminase/predicted dehydrogenase